MSCRVSIAEKEPFSRVSSENSSFKVVVCAILERCSFVSCCFGDNIAKHLPTTCLLLDSSIHSAKYYFPLIHLTTASSLSLSISYRPRTNTIAAVSRVRSVLALATHEVTQN